MDTLLIEMAKTVKAQAEDYIDNYANGAAAHFIGQRAGLLPPPLAERFGDAQEKYFEEFIGGADSRDQVSAYAAYYAWCEVFGFTTVE